VTDQNGTVLAPAASEGVGRAEQQLAFKDHIEARAVRHVEELLAPMIGRQNLRVSAAAQLDFSQVSERGVTYGPDTEMRHLEHDRKNRRGDVDQAAGVPGSLSNQPPGTASAPLQTKSQKDQKTNGQNDQSKGTQSAPAQPQSNSEKWNVDYQVGRTTHVKQGQPWTLKALAISVVLNRKAVGAHPQWTKQVQAIVAHAIAVPKPNVNVAVVPFGIQATPTTAAWPQSLLNDRALLQACMEALAALFILIGVAGPLARWVRASVPEMTWAGAPALAADRKPNELDVSNDLRREQTDKLERVRAIAQSNPKEAAEMVRGWMLDKADTFGEGLDEPD
jgi:flagellar M-ring protein FliF